MKPRKAPLLPLHRRLYSREQITTIERAVIERYDTPAFTLMLRAGMALLNTCLEYLEQGDRVAVLTGAGNNAGDGYIVATFLRERGFDVCLYSVSPNKKLSGAASRARDLWLQHSPIQPWPESSPPHIEGLSLIVDAMLGTGLHRPLSGNYLHATHWANHHPAPTIAADIPTGLCSNRGKVLGESTADAIHAKATVTFIGLKTGLYCGDAEDLCGEVVLDTLDCPEEAYNTAENPIDKLGDDDLGTLLTPRPADCHKGNFGHALLIGGDAGMQGAIRLSAEACARSGAGLVSVATHPRHAALVSAACPEVMAHGVDKPDQLRPLIERASVIAIGPGLGQQAWGLSMWQTLLEYLPVSARSREIRANRPWVIDADALNLLAREAFANEQPHPHWVLTPHPGEAARLLQCSVADIQNRREASIKALQKKYGGTIILKGKGSLIADEEGIALYPGGNPGMASGGFGDLLTGINTALLAQKLPPAAAARGATIAHGCAADLAANGATRGLLASDLFQYLRPVLNPPVAPL